MLQALMIVIIAAMLFGGTARSIASGKSLTDRPTPLVGAPFSTGLGAVELAEFRRGEKLFTKIWSTGEGLGPLLNAQSCAACHRHPVAGGSGSAFPDSFVSHSTAIRDPTGGHVFQQFFIRPGRAIVRRLPPRQIGIRRTTALFGLGLLESVPAYPEHYDITRAGLVQHADSLRGRFGWKGQERTLDEFVGSALVNELGLTNPYFPASHNELVEVTAEEVRLLSQFIRFLAPPEPRIPAPLSHAGYRIFTAVRCDSCHKPTLVTGHSAVAALRNKTIHPFTDLLTHNMGPEAAEPFREGHIGKSEFRTAPLWGLYQSGPPYLHDGRALSINDAILGHGGEAEDSVRRYNSLSGRERQLLLQFLRSL